MLVLSKYTLQGNISKNILFNWIEWFDWYTLFYDSLETLDNVKPGDCFVCFSKNDIFYVTRELERRGHEVAVIYGSLPPGKI